MEKTAIKNFAIEARKILMRSAEVQAGLYGVTKDGCSNPIQKGDGFEVYKTVAGTENRIYGEDISKRRDLVDAVNEIGFAQVMEKAAYTWFNRLIAIRFMEVNDYLPTRTRVLSSANGSKTPDIVTEYREVNLNLTDKDLEKVQMCIKENKYDDAFEYLFVKQCKELKRVLPKLFKKTDDYMELLLKLSYLMYRMKDRLKSSVGCISITIPSLKVQHLGKKVKLQKMRFLQLHSYSHQTGLYGIWSKTV